MEKYSKVRYIPRYSPSLLEKVADKILRDDAKKKKKKPTKNIRWFSPRLESEQKNHMDSITRPLRGWYE